MPVFVATHPLISHKLTRLRNEKTLAADFRHVLKEITFYLGYEATRDLSLSGTDINTPMHISFQGSSIAEKVAIIPILRAGLGMSDAMQDLMPRASVHHIGK
jgi:uracil phosphoribosyltransferase